MDIRAFLPDLVRAFAAGASDLGVWKSLSTPVMPVLGVFFPDLGVFLPDLGVFLPDLGVFLPDLGVFLPDFGVFLRELGVDFLALFRFCFGLATSGVTAAGSGSSSRLVINLFNPVGLGVAELIAVALGVFINLTTPDRIGVEAAAALGFFNALGVLKRRFNPVELGVCVSMVSDFTFGVFTSRFRPVRLGVGAPCVRAFTLGVFTRRCSPVGLGVGASTLRRLAGGTASETALGDPDAQGRFFTVYLNLLEAGDFTGEKFLAESAIIDITFGASATGLAELELVPGDLRTLS